MFNNTLELILAKTNAKPSGNNKWQGHCPSHEDNSPSFSICINEEGIGTHCHAGCKPNQYLPLMNLEESDLFLNGKANKFQKLTVNELAGAKGIPVDFLKQLGVKDHAKGVQITYYLTNGNLAPRQRLRTDTSGNTGSFWIKEKGDIVPYGLNKLSEAQNAKYLILVEGETDCWSLWFHNFPALGIPGASMTGKIKPEYLSGIDRIYVHHEPDKGGDQFVTNAYTRLKDIGFKGIIKEFNLKPHKDLNELHQKDKTNFKLIVQKSLEQAELLTKESIIVEDPKPLFRIVEDPQPFPLDALGTEL